MYSVFTPYYGGRAMRDLKTRRTDLDPLSDRELKSLQLELTALTLLRPLDTEYAGRLEAVEVVLAERMRAENPYTTEIKPYEHLYTGRRG